MSHNNAISFGGILGPLVESLERKPRQSGRLIGQDVVISDNENVTAIIAVDADDNIHLLISPAQDDDNRFSQLDLKGLEIENHEWSVSGRPATHYLDVSCSTGTLPAFRRPFLRFAEDVLYEISETKNAPAAAVYRTGMKWKRFWSADTLNEVTSGWLHGIAGELSFLTHLIDKFGPASVSSWVGPSGKDHDFQTGTDLAVEVKASVDMPFKIRCNIRQLDASIFKKLYVLCYRVLSSEKGTTLPTLVERIESMIGDDEQILDNFYEKLATAGYNRQSEQAYNQHPLEISSAAVFCVDDSFPKIAESSFVNPPDHRISNIRYTVQLTGLNELTLDAVDTDLKSLAKNE
jgi:hypothetical protein